MIISDNCEATLKAKVILSLGLRIFSTKMSVGWRKNKNKNNLKLLSNGTSLIKKKTPKTPQPSFELVKIRKHFLKFEKLFVVK